MENDIDESNFLVQRGRPEYDIDQKQLTFLVEHGLKIKDIAKMFNCSRRTFERRMSKYHVESKAFSSSSCSLNPLIGEKTVQGRLRHLGIRVKEAS